MAQVDVEPLCTATEALAACETVTMVPEIPSGVEASAANHRSHGHFNPHPHDHNLPSGFRLHTVTLGPTQVEDIVQAMKEWEATTGMDFRVGTNSSHPTPSGDGWWTEGNLIWEGDVPYGWPSYYEDKQPMATTRVDYESTHLDRSGGMDLVFDDFIDWQSTQTPAECRGEYAMEREAYVRDDPDPEKPWGHAYNNRDQRSTALHETGHWITLPHVSDKSAVMTCCYFGGFYCDWDINPPESARVATHYGHGGH